MENGAEKKAVHTPSLQEIPCIDLISGPFVVGPGSTGYIQWIKSRMFTLYTVTLYVKIWSFSNYHSRYVRMMVENFDRILALTVKRL
jgi:hypothetical protein